MHIMYLLSQIKSEILHFRELSSLLIMMHYHRGYALCQMIAVSDYTI